MRQRIIGEAVLLGGAVLAVWLVGDSAFAELFRRVGSVPAALLIGLAVAGVGLAVWLADGATLFEASSWSLPLGLLWRLPSSLSRAHWACSSPWVGCSS
jgi:hypothetical protein